MARVKEDFSQPTNYQLDPMNVEVAPSSYTLPPMEFQVQERQNVQLPPMGVPQKPMDIGQLLAMQRQRNAADHGLDERLQGGMRYVDQGGLVPAPGMISWGELKDTWPYPIPPGRQPLGVVVTPADLKLFEARQARELAIRESAGK